MTLLHSQPIHLQSGPQIWENSTPEHIVRGKVQKHIGLCFENILPLKLLAGFDRLAGFHTDVSLLNITNPVNIQVRVCTRRSVQAQLCSVADDVSLYHN